MPLCTEFHFNQNTLKIQVWTKVIQGTKFEKKFFVFRTSNPEYPFVLSFILNKVLRSLRTKLAQKSYSRDGVYKTILELKINNLIECPFVRVFILNKPDWSFGTTFAQKRYFRKKCLEKNCWIQNQLPCIPHCMEFHFKQSTLKFQDQSCPPKKYFGNKFQKNEKSWYYIL